MNSKHELPRELAELEKAIGYKFDNIRILESAMTHSSFSNEMKSKGELVKCNERLEFLGDSVLSIIVSEYIFLNYPELPEGDLSRIRAGAVCEKTLAEFSRGIELGSYLRLGHGEELTNGRCRASILADAFEALLAAIYLDGGMENVEKFLLPLITEEIYKIISSGSTRDYKTLLQQIIQQEQGELLEYITVREYGPAHKKTFEVEARLNSNVIGHGSGSTKREAEQFAAKEALILFGESDEKHEKA